MKIKVDNFELRVVINSLNDMRTKLISEGKDTEDVDNILMKYLDALKKCKQIKSKVSKANLFFCPKEGRNNEY